MRFARFLQLWRLSVSATLIFSLVFSPLASASDHPRSPQDLKTTTPIKHVIVIIGENRSFDHVFATYQPKKGETVFNLLSEGIVNLDGSPGPSFSAGKQYKAKDVTRFQIDVDHAKVP